MKKKPVCTVKSAHGREAANDQPRWISALATQHNTDLIVSGSHDGFVRIWKAEAKQRSLVQVAQVSLNEVSKGCDQEDDSEAFVNSIAIHPSGKALIVGLGQEHRLGRWWRHKSAKNGIAIVSLTPTTDANS